MNEQQLRNIAAIERSAKEEAKRQQAKREEKYRQLRAKHDERKFLKECGVEL